MEIVITELSRYFIAILMALYTYWGFRTFAAKKKKKARLVRKQKMIMYLFHFLGYAIIYLNEMNTTILGLYGFELLFLIVFGVVYKHLYQRENQPIICHMQMLFSISMVMLGRLNLDSAKHQFLYMLIGMVVCLLLPWVLEHYTKLELDGWFYAVLGVIILLVVLFFGNEKYGAKNWLTLGPVVLQPSEFVKILFVFAFASILSHEALNFHNVVKISAMAAVFVLILVLEKDLGGAVIFFICYLFMLFVATGQAVYLLGGLLSGSGAAVAAYFLFSHVRTRVIAWRDPWSTINNQGYQVAQSLFAIGTGGWFGMGLTQGMPKTIPIRESDFIFAAIAEELGVFFSICLILVYLICFIWFINVTVKVKKTFYKLVTLGFSVIIMFQTFLTLGGVTKFIPSTGVTLPLVSAGGSSVLSMIFMFCTIASINLINSKEVEENVVDQTQESEGE